MSWCYLVSRGHNGAVWSCDVSGKFLTAFSFQFQFQSQFQFQFQFQEIPLDSLREARTRAPNYGASKLEINCTASISILPPGPLISPSAISSPLSQNAQPMLLQCHLFLIMYVFSHSNIS